MSILSNSGSPCSIRDGSLPRTLPSQGLPLDPSNRHDPGELLLSAGLSIEAEPFVRRNALTRGAWQDWTNLACCLRIQTRISEALEAIDKSLELEPSAPFTWHNKGMILDDLGRFDDAFRCYVKAMELGGGNNSIMGVAFGLLRQGVWNDTVWALWDKGACAKFPEEVTGFKTWRGEPIAGKRLLILQQGGYGDIILYLRWLETLKNLGAKSTLVIWDRMVELLEGHPWVDKAIPYKTGEVAYADFDYVLPLMSLTSRLKVKISEIPVHDSYLRTETVNCDALSPFKPNIGICWRAEESGTIRRYRSLTLEEIDPLSGFDANWISLQYGEDSPAWMKTPDVDGWRNTAEIIAGLDLVISADTAVMHLAGAMGKPTWMLLPCNSDWKWMKKGERNLWYPSVRNFRNSDPYGFKGVVENVMEALEQWPS